MRRLKAKPTDLNVYVLIGAALVGWVIAVYLTGPQPP